MSGVKLSEMTADTTVEGTEKLLALDGSTSKTLTTAKMAEYAIDVLAATSVDSPVTTSDFFLAFRSGTEKLFDVDVLAQYVVASGWSTASEADPVLTGDMLLIDRAGTIFEVDVDTLTTYALTGVQATVANLSTLDSGTPANTDLVLICQTNTGKKATIAALETLLWTDFATYVAGLSAASAVADANLIYVIQGSTPKYVTATVLAEYMSDEIISIGDVQTDTLSGLPTHVDGLDAVATPTDNDLLYCVQSGNAKKITLTTLANYTTSAAFDLPWKLVDSSNYTALPASTSTITMSDTGDFEIGYPVKYTYGGSTYYGIVTAISANALLTIAGAPLNTGVELTDLYAGLPSSVVTKTFVVDTAYGDAAQDIFSAVTYQRERWQMGPAYLVTFSATHGVADTGASQPKVNVKVAGNLVSSNDTSKGVTLSATPGTWTANSAVAITTANYDVAYGDAIDIRCTEAGTNGDADILSVTCVFVLE